MWVRFVCRVFVLGHKPLCHGIIYRMFYDEILEKFRIEDAFAPFTVAMFGNTEVVAGGVKAVLFSSAEEVKVRFSKKCAIFRGKDLRIVEIGGGDVLVRGEISEVEFE